MSKRSAIAIALLVGAVAVLAPIVTALYLAREQSFNEQKAAIAAVAADILRRSDETGDQIEIAFDRLGRVKAVDPCSPDNIRLMAKLAIASDELQGVGYVADDKLICSSLGLGMPAMAVGRVSYESTTRKLIRSSVILPFVTNKAFLLVTYAKTGYTAIVDPNLPIDVPFQNRYTSLGLIGYSSGKVMTMNGRFDRSWLDTLGSRLQVQFSDGNSLVALDRSHNYDVVAFAAVPLGATRAGFWRAATILVPIGIVAGLALALAVFYLARHQMALPAVIKVALRRNEFFVLYQPLVDLRTRAWVGAEALIRWRRPNGELVRPDLFIPVAEEAGLIQQITERVVHLVGKEARGLFDRFPHFHLGINLAAADLQSPHAVELMRGLREATRAQPGSLVVEATERGLIKAGIGRQLLRDFRASGMLVAIDDFGTGYSSLSYLQSFELDILKIDKSFVDTIGAEAATSQVVFHIIEMAKSLNLRLIAEGVENEAQAQVLRDHGVELAQGWLFAKAMPFAELVAQLEGGQPLPKAV